MTRIYLNDDWNFTRKFDKALLTAKPKATLEKVRLPHSFSETPLNYFNESVYEAEAGYLKVFKTESAWKGKRVFITFEGAAHEATVYLNGKSLGTHSSGYTAFTFELTKNLLPAGKNNTLVVKLDSSEKLDVPPFGFIIDYMTYGGIYRDVYIDVKPETYIEDIFAKTEEKSLLAEVLLNGNIPEKAKISASVSSKDKKGKPLYSSEVNVISANTKNSKVSVKLDCPKVELWSPEKPNLYDLTTSFLDSKGNLLDEKTVCFGFRDVVINSEGLFLNGNKYHLRGLNRHQSYPYVGYAMPSSIQEFDADVLKYELGLNAVRTSHYPQSQAFIDRCDEIGLLV